MLDKIIVEAIEELLSETECEREKELLVAFLNDEDFPLPKDFVENVLEDKVIENTHFLI